MVESFRSYSSRRYSLADHLYSLFSILYSLADPRIWVGHFHSVDFIISSNEGHEVSFDGINFKSITKYREHDTGKASLLAPPRPAATKIVVQQSIFYDRESLTFSEYSIQSGDVINRRRRKRSPIEAVENDFQLQ